MIARTWQGWAPPTTADAYEHHYSSEVATHLQDIPGFQGAHLLRTQDGSEVRFTSITFFTDMDAVRAFAGPTPEDAVVEEAARAVLSRWDPQVIHQQVAVSIR
jgi:heme-degrading monooxygenase HmoA